MKFFKRILLTLINTSKGNVEQAQKKHGSQQKAKQSATDYTPICIAKRHQYREEHRSFPTDRINDVKKILALEIGDKNIRYVLSNKINGEIHATLWYFADKLPASLITLPESLLVSKTIADNEIARVCSNQPYFVANTKKGVHSTIQGSVIKDENFFAMSIGVSDSALNVVHIPQERIEDDCISGIQKLNVKDWWAFVNWKQIFNPQKVALHIAVPAGIVFTAYLAFSSLYLGIQNFNINAELAEYREKVSTVLSLEDKVSKNELRYQKIQTTFADHQLISPMWFALDTALQAGQVKNIREAQGRIVIRGSTNKATDLLEKISKLPMVHNAKFDYPTRKNRGSEQYVIGYQLQGFKPSSLDDIAKSQLPPKLTKDLAQNKVKGS